MDYQTAYNLLLKQGLATVQDEDALIPRLRQGKPPLPGLVTSILLALKVVFEALRHATTLDRELALALYLLSRETRQQFEWGQQTGVDWPPLLHEDLTRIEAAVRSSFAGTWHG